MAYMLPTATLGRTGLVVTRLGIGGAYCKTPEGYVRALDCGVNYLDTAHAYMDGEDEKTVGLAIAGRRDQIVLATKSDKRQGDEARRELETSLESLGTDHVDLWQLHYLNEESDLPQILARGGALKAAIQARAEGLTRFIGVTGHKWPLVQAALATGHFDTALCWYNCAYREAEETVLAEAQRQNSGVIIMNASRNDKLFGEGPEAPDEADFYRYVLSHPAVTVTIMGLRDVDRFERIAKALSERSPLASEEKPPLEAYGAQMRATGKLEMG